MTSRHLLPALLILGALALPAQAQLRMGPFEGHVTGFVGDAVPADGTTTRIVGGSVSVIDPSGWGAEVDAGVTRGGAVRSGALDVQTYTVGPIYQRVRGRVRPYATAALGTMRIRGCLSGCDAVGVWNAWGLAAGAGLQLRINDAFAVRGEGRFFSAARDERNPARPASYRFWRLSAGLTWSWEVS
jgi:opacity protein-like surface antigen